MARDLENSNKAIETVFILISVLLLIYLFIHFFIYYLFIYLFICLFVCLFLIIYLFVCSLFCLFAYLFIIAKIQTKTIYKSETVKARYYIPLMVDVAQSLIFSTSYYIYSKLLMMLLSY